MGRPYRGFLRAAVAAQSYGTLLRFSLFCSVATVYQVALGVLKINLVGRLTADSTSKCLRQATCSMLSICFKLRGGSLTKKRRADLPQTQCTRDSKSKMGPFSPHVWGRSHTCQQEPSGHGCARFLGLTQVVFRPKHGLWQALVSICFGHRICESAAVCSTARVVGRSLNSSRSRFHSALTTPASQRPRRDGCGKSSSNMFFY